jgi:Leucine-rich repeat (LRR) protein
MQNPVQNQNPTPVMPPPPVQEYINQTPDSNNSSRNTLLLIGSILIFVAIVGITLYFLVQNQQEQAGVMTDDATNTENQQAIEPNQAQIENEFVPDKSVICARFTNVENALKYMEQACVLDLSGQDLSEVPEGVYKLTKLNETDLSNNNLTTIPQKLIDMPNMISINLSENNISSIAGIKNKTAPVISDPEATPAPFIGLQSLNLSGNPISEADQEKLKQIFGNNASSPNSDSPVVKF